MFDKKKAINLGDTEVNRRIQRIEENESFQFDPGKDLAQKEPIVYEQSNWRRHIVILLVVALAIAVAVALLVESNDDSVTEGTVAPTQDEIVTTAPIPVEEPELTSVSSMPLPEVAAETVRVPIVTSSAEAVDVEPEPVTVEVSPETVEVSNVAVAVVDQTQVEMRPVEATEGVTFNEFEAMEQTVQQPKLQQTTTIQPSTEPTVTVSPPGVASVTYPRGVLQMSTPLFEDMVEIYLPVVTEVPRDWTVLENIVFGSILISFNHPDPLASGEARYFIEVGDPSDVHREEIYLTLGIPRVDDVRGVEVGPYDTTLSAEEVRSRLIKDACSDVGNLRAVMEQAKTKLVAEAGGYELVFSWNNQQGKYVAEDISDAELISYCQLG